MADSAQSQKVTIRRAPWSPAAVVALLAAQRYDTSGGLESVDAYARRSFPMFECSDDAGEVLGRYVLAVQRSGGLVNVQIIAAAGSAPGVDLTGVMLAGIESQAQLLGASWISLQTRRRGLVRKLMRRGFADHGTILRKLVRVGQ